MNASENIARRKIIKIENADPTMAILGIARAVQRKVQGLGNIAKRSYMRESSTYRYISHEVDNVYKAMDRLIKEIGR